MGLAEQTDIPFGLVGIGYKSNEASLETVQTTYPNLPISMQTSGNIKTVAYSLWLNDLDASKGSLLFGAIDTEKYQGNLALLDLLPSNSRTGQITEFNVALTSVSGHSSSGSDSLTSSSFPMNALLDSGTTLSYLPSDITNQIWQEVGAAYVQSLGVAVVPCTFATSSAYFSFGFGGSQGPRINITMDELVLESAGVTLSNGRHKGTSACVFGIQAQPSSDGSPNNALLGDTFLRSAYVVYDLENNQVAIAPTKFNASSSNVVPFPSKGATIPSSTPVPGSNTTTSGSGSTSTSEPDYKASPGFQSGATTIGLSALGLVAISMSTFFAVFATAI